MKFKEYLQEQIPGKTKSEEEKKQREHQARRQMLKSHSRSMSADRESEANSEKRELQKEGKLLNVKTPSPEQAAKKGKVSLKDFMAQLKQGIKIEKEHTTNAKVAREIALDHLGERPDYYKRLKKVEESTKPTATDHLKWATARFKQPRAQAGNLYRFHMIKASEHKSEAEKHPVDSVAHKLHITQTAFHTLRAKHYAKERLEAPVKIGRGKRK